jgi:hypothetical protein
LKFEFEIEMEGKEKGEIKWEKKKVTVHLGRFPSLQPT